MKPRLIAVLAAMIALLAAALATGTGIYYALFYILMMTVLFSLASVLWTLFSLSVSMRGMRSRVERGDTLPVVLTVRHTSLLPAGIITLSMNVPSGGGSRELTVSSLPFRDRELRVPVRCLHRGIFEAGVDTATAEDVFGLFSIARKLGKKLLRVEVSPKAVTTACMQLKAQDMGPEYRSAATEDNASPSDIRAWQQGDELKKIHWKLSLRKRELIVRTFEDSARPDTLIVPDLTELQALREQRLTIEDSICEICLGAAKAQIEGGFPVRVPLQSAAPRELNIGSPKMLGGLTDALTHVRFDSPWSYERVLLLMMQRLARTGGAILITAHLTGRIADLAVRMQRSGIQVCLWYAGDTPAEETLEMLERLKRTGIRIERRADADIREKADRELFDA